MQKIIKLSIKYKEFLIIFAATLISNLAVYANFIGNLNVIGQYWDGPLYIYVAKTFYSIPFANPFNIAPYYLSSNYFAAHLIGFPFTIRIFSIFGGLFSGELIAVYLATSLFLVFFYLYAKQLRFVDKPLILTLILLIIFPRWIIYHAVGASEPLFMMFIFLSFYLYQKKRIFPALIAAALSTSVRIFGLLLFPIYVLILVKDNRYKQLLYTLLIPIPILLNFAYYSKVFNNFFAYFSVNQTLIGKPFDLISISAQSATPSYSEFVIMLIVIAIAALSILYKANKEMFIYLVIFLMSLTMVIHQDLSRYMIPLLPAVAIAFNKQLTNKYFLIALPLIIIIEYIYVWNAIPYNLAPQGIFQQLTI